MKFGGHLEQRVAEEEDAGAKTEDRGREAQILVHGEGGEAGIHPVDEIDHKEQHHERDQPPGAFA